MNIKISDRDAQMAALCALFDGVVVLAQDGSCVSSSCPFGDEFARFTMLESCPLKPLIAGCFRGEPFDGIWSGIRIGEVREARPWHVRGAPIRDDFGNINLIALAFLSKTPELESVPGLRRQLHEYESIFLRMKQGVWRIDEDGKINNVNPYLAAWLEMESSQMIGRHYSEFVTEVSPSIDVQQSSISERFEARFTSGSGVNRSAIVVRTRLRNPGGESNGWLDVITDITTEHAVQARLMREVQRMANLASMDALTGLANRRTFDLLLASYLENSQDRPFGLLVLDVDGLKEINDTQGHEAGDRVLSEFAVRLKNGLRTSDHVARLGGDEFACIVPDVSPEEFADAVRRCEESCSFEIEFRGGKLPVRASIGCVHSAQSNEAMLATADRQMYHHKLGRRNRN